VQGYPEVRCGYRLRALYGALRRHQHNEVAERLRRRRSTTASGIRYAPDATYSLRSCFSRHVPRKLVQFESSHLITATEARIPASLKAMPPHSEIL
jgi:hypothetical protein